LLVSLPSLTSKMMHFAAFPSSFVPTHRANDFRSPFGRMVDKPILRVVPLEQNDQSMVRTRIVRQLFRRSGGYHRNSLHFHY
jgi:hypothetical protein